MRNAKFQIQLSVSPGNVPILIYIYRYVYIYLHSREFEVNLIYFRGVQACELLKAFWINFHLGTIILILELHMIVFWLVCGRDFRRRVDLDAVTILLTLRHGSVPVGLCACASG